MARNFSMPGRASASPMDVSVAMTSRGLGEPPVRVRASFSLRNLVRCSL